MKAFVLMTRSNPPILGNLSGVATVIFAISKYLQPLKLNVNLVFIDARIFLSTIYYNNNVSLKHALLKKFF